jgi:hypothetical protein
LESQPSINGELSTTDTSSTYARAWTDADRAEARRLHAEGLSWSQIALRVCGDRRFTDRGRVDQGGMIRLGPRAADMSLA